MSILVTLIKMTRKTNPDGPTKVPTQAPQNCCWTLNNWTERQVQSLRLLAPDSGVSYICWGYEKCPTSDTPHLQGYCEIEKDTRMKFMTLHKYLFRSHIERRVGTQEEAINYCKGICAKKKDLPLNKFEEYGTPAVQGKGVKVCFDKALELVKGGISRDKLFEEMTGLLRYSKSVDVLFEQFSPFVPKSKPKVIWYWGDAGVGKSYQAFLECGYKREDVYAKCCTTKWFDGYRNQPCVVFDDYGENACTAFRATGLKMLIDEYAGDVEAKGRVLKFSPKLIIFTSAKHPSEYFSDPFDPNEWAQMERRIDEIIRVCHTPESIRRLELKQRTRERVIGDPSLRPVYSISTNQSTEEETATDSEEYGTESVCVS